MNLPFSKIKTCFVLIFTLGLVNIYAQKVTRIEIINADSFEFDERLGNGAKRLLGHVKFKQDNVIMNSDSAYYYDNNSLDAFSNVHINQNDTVNLYGDFLKYNGNTKMAEVTGKVVTLRDRQITLTTDKLNFNMSSNIGYYQTKGKIVTKDNILTSQFGYYYSAQKNLFFKKNVLLVNKEYTMKCDSLRYHTISEIAYFTGPTTIVSQENTIYCENGWYDTKNDVSQFNKNAWLKNKEQKIHGDSLYYNKKIGYGKALKNVAIDDSVQKLSIKGNIAEFFEKLDKSIVTDKAVMEQYFKDDTLYLHADTLKATYDSTYFAIKDQRLKELQAKNKGKKNPEEPKVEMEDSISTIHRKIFAHYKVKFYKNDLQGLCDSLVYTSFDSLMNLYKNPLLWSNENQLVADDVSIKMNDGKIYKMFLNVNAFITSQYDSLRFNQIKGKNMTGYFLENDLRKIDVIGNGQTIYYAKDDDDGSLVGVNKAECSDMAIYITNNKVEKLKMYKKPAGTMFPPKQADPAEMVLKDFKWWAAYRPLTPSSIFDWKPLEITGNRKKDKGKKKK